jgi:hypothetical protein
MAVQSLSYIDFFISRNETFPLSEVTFVKYTPYKDRPVCVSFSCYPGLFRVFPVPCTNPRCTDTHVTLKFEEIDELLVVKKRGTLFYLDLDYKRGTVKHSGKLPAVLLPLSSEFMESLTSEILKGFETFVCEAKEKTRRIEEYRLDGESIENGILVNFSDIVSDNNPTSGKYSPRFYVSHKGTECVVEDLYCPRLTCDCQNVNLLFLEIERHGDGDNAVKGEMLRVEVPFKGRITLPETMKCSPGKARSLIKEFFLCYPDAMEEFRENYVIVKDIARRSLAAGAQTKQKEERLVQSPRLPAISPGAKTGRNEPCPCGSGKKYKKCCGR